MRQTDLLDHLTAQDVAKKARPRRVLGNFKVVQGQIAFGKLGLEDVDERGWKSRGDDVE